MRVNHVPTLLLAKQARPPRTPRISIATVDCTSLLGWHYVTPLAHWRATEPPLGLATEWRPSGSEIQSLCLSHPREAQVQTSIEVAVVVRKAKRRRRAGRLRLQLPLPLRPRMRLRLHVEWLRAQSQKALTISESEHLFVLMRPPAGLAGSAVYRRPAHFPNGARSATQLAILSLWRPSKICLLICPMFALVTMDRLSC